MPSRRAVLSGFAAVLSALLLIVGVCSPAEPQSPPAQPATATPTAPVTPTAAKAAETPAATGTGPVHACSGAGRWFPAKPDELAKAVDGYLAVEAPVVPRTPIMLIVPHAGYEYSGAIAGKAYATVKGKTFKRVIIIGLSHQVPLRGASILRADAYDTPLGRIPVDIEARDALLRCPVVSEKPEAHLTEHSVENQLPFLQRAIGSFKMVEILAGIMAPVERAELANAIRPLLDADTLLVVSSDFTHYGATYGYVPFTDNIPERLAALNNMAVQKILQVDVPGWDAYIDATHDTVCGQAGIGLALKVLEPMDDVCGARLAFDTSGRAAKNYDISVSYAAIAFWHAGDGLTAAEQKTLLELARDTATQFLKTGQSPEADPAKYTLTAALKSPGAAFVTLTNGGRLRGCIGHVVAIKPLYQSVAENACHACLDPRFTTKPITEAEMPAISVEISVLTPIRRLDDPSKIRVGRDGLVLVKGQNQGLLLPQVPGEQGWDRDQFLEGLCQKAGLPAGAWKDKQAVLYRFSAQVFGEKKEGK